MKAKAVRIPFDTLAYTQTLRKAGIDEACASAHAEALAMAFTQGVATREDIEDLDSKVAQEFTKVRSEMAQGFTKVRAEMAQGFTEVRAEMTQGFTEVRAEIAQKFTKVRAEMGQMRLLIIATLAVVALTNPIALHILRLARFLH